jgi:signal transduction histidine kinase
MLRYSLEEARAFVWGLRPSGDDHDLAATIESAGRRVVGDQPVELRVTRTGQARPLPHSTQNELFRIAVEGITNAVKHAQPTRIAVEVRHEADHVAVLVTDDGVGMDEARRIAAEAGGHFGLQAMIERAALIGAQLEVRPGEGGGTVVEVNCPVPPASRPQPARDPGGTR